MATVSSASVLDFIDRLEKGGICMHGFERRVQGEVRAGGLYAPFRKDLNFNWDESLFIVKPTHEPGTMFNYDTSCSQVLCAMCQQVTEHDLLDFLQVLAFDPIGASDPKRWLTDPSDISRAARCMYAAS